MIVLLMSLLNCTVSIFRSYSAKNMTAQRGWSLHGYKSHRCIGAGTQCLPLTQRQKASLASTKDEDAKEQPAGTSILTPHPSPQAARCSTYVSEPAVAFIDRTSIPVCRQLARPVAGRAFLYNCSCRRCRQPSFWRQPHDAEAHAACSARCRAGHCTKDLLLAIYRP